MISEKADGLLKYLNLLRELKHFCSQDKELSQKNVIDTHISEIREFLAERLLLELDKDDS